LGYIAAIVAGRTIACRHRARRAAVIHGRRRKGAEVAVAGVAL
jgi:hypothetical protein